MSIHNNHQYQNIHPRNSVISSMSNMPPPLMRFSPHSGNNFSGSVQSNWPHSPMNHPIQSPRATPPLSRSPYPSTMGQKVSSSPTLSNHSGPSQGENPLQSLQKMVLLDPDSSDSSVSVSRHIYDTQRNSPPITVTQCAPKPSSFFNNSSNNNTNSNGNNNDQTNPYSSYYMDQNKMCTPPNTVPIIINCSSSYGSSSTSTPKATNIGGIEIATKEGGSKSSTNGISLKERSLIKDLNNDNRQKVRSDSVDSYYSSDSDNIELKNMQQNNRNNIACKSVEKVNWPSQDRNSKPIQDSSNSPYTSNYPDARMMPPPSQIRGSYNNTGWSNQISCGRGRGAHPADANNRKKRGRPLGSRGRPRSVLGRGISTSSESQVAPNFENTILLPNTPPSARQVQEIGINTAISLDKNIDPPFSIGISKTTSITPGRAKKPVKNVQKNTGPFVHMERVKFDKVSYSIVNVNRKIDDERDPKKNRATELYGRPPKKPFVNALRKKITGQKLEVLTNDSSWICVFCKQLPHHKGLGDLFGPYFVPDNKGTEEKKEEETEANQMEVWFHEDCIVWSNGVYLVGNRVRNIEDVVKESLDTICCKCKLGGASLACLQKGCVPRFHYLCAKEKGCDMDEENFSIHCQRHKKKQKE